jgi:drug/metabolite transporter (DMT)-like permease
MGAVMALANTILAVSFFLKGVQKIGASTAALISTAEPAITVVLAYFLLGEKRTLVEVLGTVLVLLSILLTVYQPSASKAVQQSTHQE